MALGAAVTALIVSLGGALLKTRRSLADQNSAIAQGRSDSKAGTWLNEQLMSQVTRAEAARDATIRAAKELFDQREAHVEKIARLEERLSNCQQGAAECLDRAQRAESRAAVAEEHMRKQAEQMLVQSMNIDRLTTELAKHDTDAAVQLTPKRQNQPLLVPDPGEHQA